MKQRRFCVLATQRSGSTYLLSLLNSNPEVDAFHELFLLRGVGGPLAWVADGSPDSFYYFRKKTIWPRPISIFLYLRYVQRHGAKHGAVGFKLMLSQAKAFPDVVLALGLYGYRIIFLTRTNVFAQCVSGYLTKSSGLAHSREVTPIEPVLVEPGQLIHDMRKRLRVAHLADQLIRNSPLPVERIEYEQLCDNPTAECNRIFMFLGVNTQSSVWTDMKKRVNVPYRSLMKNYDEVEAALVSAGLDSYLHSDRFSAGSSGHVPG